MHCNAQCNVPCNIPVTIQKWMEVVENFANAIFCLMTFLSTYIIIIIYSTTRITIMHYGNKGCWVFKRRVQNWKDFCLITHTPKENYWILRIGVMGRCQKVPKFDFQSQFSMSKIIGIFLFFSLKNINFGAHFVLLAFLITSFFKTIEY